MIYIGLDDTDMPGTRGTGSLARSIAQNLSDICQVRGVSRHQLLKDPAVPMTKNNSANIVHIEKSPLSPKELADRAEAMMREAFIEGSDPGLCVVSAPDAAMQAFGWRTRQELVSAEEAFAAASGCEAILRQLGGTGGGIIGAVAGSALASTGQNGRFVMLGQIRDLAGSVSVAAVREAGISDVRRVDDGMSLSEGMILQGEKIRPEVIDGQSVLLVEPHGAAWMHVRRD